MSAPAASFPRLDRSSSCEEVQSTLGELVMAVMRFAAHSREAAEVIDDLFETGRIRAILRGAADATTDDDEEAAIFEQVAFAIERSNAERQVTQVEATEPEAGPSGG